MHLLELLRRWSKRNPRCRRQTLYQGRPTPRLWVEALETRWLPSVVNLASFANAITGTSPISGLVADANGFLYGTTQTGGTSNDGTVFQYIRGDGLVNLTTFTGTANGAKPQGNLFVDANGNVFGTTFSGGQFNDGTIFEEQAQLGNQFTFITLASFSGSNGNKPTGGLVMDSSGNIFGTTAAGGQFSDGTVFELKPYSNTPIALASFNGSGNGATPNGGLVLDPSGVFYGTTASGGSSNDGTLFRFSKTTGISTVVTFTGANGATPEAGLIEDSSGNLYGTTSAGTGTMGTVFELLKGSSTISTLGTFAGMNGATPQAGLFEDSSGDLFGTTFAGGAASVGTIFEVPHGGALTPLSSFQGNGFGAGPNGSVFVDSSGNVFGTSQNAGAFGNYGTVYELPASSGTIMPLAAFNGVMGGDEPTGLVLDSSGIIYGTDGSAGPSGDGTVFSYNPTTNTVTTLVNLASASLANPDGTVLEDSSGNLYGVAGGGTSATNGAVWELKKGATSLTVLATFTGGADGKAPEGALYMDSSGNLFGTTEAQTSLGGSTLQYGTVFEIKAASGVATTIVGFNSADGANPVAGVTEDTSGNIFGTTSFGGMSGVGTLFEIKAGTMMLNTLVNFGASPAANKPLGGIIVDSSDNVFGLAALGGPQGGGVLYEVKAGSGVVSPLFNFNGTTQGTFPQSTLITDGSGNLYGSTENSVFEYNIAGNTMTILGSLNFYTGEFGQGTLARDKSGDLFVAAQDDAAFFDGSLVEVPAATPPVILTSSLPNWTANQAGYNQTINFSGGAGAVTFATSGGTLPTGLTLNSSTGVLAGTPTAAGSFNFTITATDVLNETGNHNYTVVINPPMVILTTSLPSGTMNSAYNQTISASGGTGTLAFSQTAGTLPPGLTLTGGGVLSGTPTAAGSFNFTVTATDTVGASASQSYNLIITGPPAKLAFLAQPVNMPTGLILPAVTVEILDASGNLITSDNTDTVTLGIASGPGSFLPGSITTATFHGGVATFSNLTLVVPGTYTLSEVVPTLYTGPNSSAFSILPLQVVSGSFAGSPSGFSVQLNAPFLVNSVTPVLYGHGFGATAPPPSVIVTTDPGNLSDTASYVEGSLVLNTGSNSMTFVATNTAYEQNKGAPQLPDGTYTVILRSSAANDGFQALNSGGGFLDGLGNGSPGSGDFTATFTVNVAASNSDVVWVPDTADGPGQALSAPGKNQVGGGYPILLDSSTASVTSVQLTLNYNPALLTVTSVSGTGFTMSGSSTPGQAILQYSGPALAAGSKTPIGFLNATVPGGTTANPTPYKAKDLLHLSNVTVNGGAAATSDGLHLVAYVGDADGNGSYSSNDAVLITRALLSTDSGFAAYPLVDPVIVADTDGSGFIPADASLQANEAGVGDMTANLTLPPIPSGVVFQPIPNNVDPTLSLVISPLSFAKDQGQMTNDEQVAVNISDAHPAGSTGLIEAHVALTYDPRQFTVSAADVHAGSLLAGENWSIVPTIDQTTGQILIALSSSTPITSGLGGSLVTIDFHLNDGEPGGVSPRSSNPSSINLVPSATELEDAQGTFILTFGTTTSVMSSSSGLSGQHGSDPLLQALGGLAGLGDLAWNDADVARDWASGFQLYAKRNSL